LNYIDDFLEYFESIQIIFIVGSQIEALRHSCLHLEIQNIKYFFTKSKFLICTISYLGSEEDYNRIWHDGSWI